MAEAGVLAYPVVLAAMVGVFRVGRAQRWESMEWMRLGALAALFGFIVAFQVKLVMLGVARDPLTLLSGAASLVGMASLVGLYLWEKWQRAHLTTRPQATA